LIRIRAAIEAAAWTYRRGNVIELPMAAVLTSGAKPS
jgi:hypothetical protein